ncbi:MAG: response regulator, partial [Gammaproteobacteria bacterium]|nr:response regulator [Gammaproteobacteria bacterium]
MSSQETSITHSALGWVKKSIDDNLSEIEIDLKHYIEEQDEVLLENVKERLGVIQGVLVMIEQYGAAMLTEEMVALADFISTSKQEKGEQALEVMLRAVLQLPDYLEHIQSGHRDIPIAILPLLNDIRAVRNQDLFSEKLLFLPDLSMHQEDAEIDAIDNNSNQASKLLAKKLRPIYQLALVNVIKEQSLEESLKRLERVCETLEERSFSEQIARIWWIIGALIESVSRQQLELGVSIKNLLGKVDALFRVILIIGEKGLLQRQPVELIKNFLYYIAQPECDGPKTQAIKTAYRLEQFLPSESARSEVLDNIAGPNQALLKTVAEAMKADIESIKSTLEVYVNGDLAQVAALKDLPQEMHIISDTLAMIGLGSQRQLIEAQIDVVKEIVSGNRAADEEQLLSMAAELLQVEQALDQMQKRQPFSAEQPRSESDVSRDYELDSVLAAVVSATLDDIQKTKNAILEFIKDSSRGENIELCIALMEESRGALQLMNQQRAVAVVDGLLTYLKGYDIVEFMEASRLDALSQVVVSLEYYLEALGEHRSDAGSILDFADVQLQELLSKVHIRTEDQESDELVVVVDDAVDDDAKVEISGVAPTLGEADAQPAAATTSVELEEPVEAESIEPDQPVVVPESEIVSGEAEPEAIVVADIAADQKPAEIGTIEATLQHREDEVTIDGDFGAVPEQVQSGLETSQDDVEAASNAAITTEVEAIVVPAKPVEVIAIDEELDVLKAGSDPEILEIYLEEAEEESQNIVRLQQDWLLHPEDENAVKNIRRAFHTIKGSGRLVGATKIGEFAWDYEQLLNRVIDKTIPPNRPNIEAVGKAADALVELVNELKTSAPPKADINYLRGLARSLAEFKTEQLLIDHTQTLTAIESPYDRITDGEETEWKGIEVGATTQVIPPDNLTEDLLEEIEPDTMQFDRDDFQVNPQSESDEDDSADAFDGGAYDDTLPAQPLAIPGVGVEPFEENTTSTADKDESGQEYTQAVDYAQVAAEQGRQANDENDASITDGLEQVASEAIMIETIGEDFLGDDLDDDFADEIALEAEAPMHESVEAVDLEEAEIEEIPDLGEPAAELAAIEVDTLESEAEKIVSHAPSMEVEEVGVQDSDFEAFQDSSEGAGPEAFQVEAEDAEPEAFQVEVEGAELEAFQVEAEDAEPEAFQVEAENAEPEAFQFEVEGAELEAFQVEVEDAELEAFQVEVEDAELEAFQVEAEDAEPEAFQVDVEGAEPETFQVDTGDSESEAIEVEIDGAEPEMIQVEIMDTDSEAFQFESSGVDFETPEIEASDVELEEIEIESTAFDTEASDIEASDAELEEIEFESLEQEAVDEDTESDESRRAVVQETPPDPLVVTTENLMPGEEAGESDSRDQERPEPTGLSFDPELLIIYQQEVEQHLGIVSFALDYAEEIQELIPGEEIYRALHTIHGASRTADISTIGELAGLMEKPLKSAISQKMALDHEIVALYREGQRALKNMTAELVATRQLPDIPQDLEISLRALAEDFEEYTVEIPEDEAEPTGEFIDTLTMMSESGDTEQDDELLTIFVDEANELLEMSDNTLHEWTQQKLDEPGAQDYSSVMELQRYLHTLKGGARMAELKQISDLSHEMESMFIAVIDGRVDKNDNLIELLKDCFDLLHRQVLEAQQAGEMSDSSNLVELLKNLRRGETDEADDEFIDDGSGINMDSEDIDIVSENLPGEPLSGPERLAQDVIKVRSDLLDNLVSSAGEVSIYRARMEQQVAGLGSYLGELGQTITRLKGQLRNLEAETDAQIHYSHRSESGKLGDFDPLEMDRYTLIQELSRSLGESVNDLSSLQTMLGEQVKDSETLLLQQSRVNTDLQDGLIKSRMVKFSGLLSRLRRLVRQSSQELGKKAELVVTGEENEVDNKVLDRMVAPLEHIIRNALSHGIETPVERVKKGKPESGKISIDITRDGSDIIIRVKDDGAGVNIEKVRSRAIQLGLLDQKHNVSEGDLVQYILEPGFSTAEHVTQLSGRGVGMDVVDIEIKQLGGTLQIETAPQGTTFTARLPFTLSINQAILVRTGDETYAIPLINIEGITRLDAQQMFKYYHQEDAELEYAGQQFALHGLGKLVGMESEFRVDAETEKQAVIFSRSGDVRVALHVDEIIGNREIVVKTLGKQLSQVKGLAGASILADGSVVLILDINGLVRHSVNSAVKIVYHEGETGEVSRARETVMVVDDSITMRRVASKLLERHNYEVITAKDGVDALAQLQDLHPDVMLLDIEMPRMDGFELATHMQNEESFSRIPIIM